MQEHIIYGAFVDQEMLLRVDMFWTILLEAIFIISVVMVVEGGGGGLGGRAVWYFVHICGRWNEGGGK